MGKSFWGGCGFYLIALIGIGFAASPDQQLVDAAQKGDVADMDDALSAGAQVKSQRGIVAFLTALSFQDKAVAIAMVKKLLDHGADINAPGPSDNQGTESALQAAINGFSAEEMVPVLLDHNPDLKAVMGAGYGNPEGKGDSLVALALRRQLFSIVHELIDHGAPVDIANANGVTPLMLIAQGNRYQAWQVSDFVDLAKLFISKGATPAAADKNGKSAATYALENNNYDLLLLLDTKHAYAAKYEEVKKADLNQRLSSAVARHQEGLIHWINGPTLKPVDTLALISDLLKQGADPNALSFLPSITIFGQALRDSPNVPSGPADPALIQILLDYGADPNRPFPSGNIPLATAINNSEVFTMLLAKGADPLATVEKSTPHIVSPSPGAPPTLTTSKETLTLLQLAAASGDADVVKALLDRKADIEQVNGDGMTPLLLALSNGNSPAAALLIQRGAKTDAKDKSGKTAADYAAASLDISLLRKLHRDDKYASLLSQYSPLPNDPIVGNWILGDEKPIGIHLVLNPDGGGVTELGRVHSQAIAWRASGSGYTLEGIVPPMERYPLPMPFKESLTYQADAQTLTAQEERNGQLGPTYIYHRPGQPPPLKSIIYPPPMSPPPAEDIGTVILKAKSSSPGFLNLIDPNLTQFPEAAYQIIGLGSIQMVGTKIEKIPDDFGKFRLMEHATLNNNQISEIGEGFFDLTNLNSLNLGSNRLTSISPGLMKLKRLQDLNLDDNRISQLPEGWGDMPVLKNLILCRNRLQHAPMSIYLAPQLSFLNLGDNLLSDLPAEWKDWSLDYLGLSQNRFTTIPTAIFRMASLKSLDISSNQISAIPPELATVPDMTGLDLSRNLLTAIPDLGKSHIERLDLSGNRIASLPADKGALPPTLRDLNLNNNQLTDVPDWIFDLNLRSLNLFGNPMPDEKIRGIERRIRDADDERRKKK